MGRRNRNSRTLNAKLGQGCNDREKNIYMQKLEVQHGEQGDAKLDKDA